MVRLAIPIVLAELGWMAEAVVDTMMVGRLPDSATAMGAVGLGGNLFFAIAIFGVGLLLGLDTLVSQAFGRGDRAGARHSLVNAVYLAVPVTPVMMGGVWLLSGHLGSFGVEPHVLAQVRPYLWSMLWGLPPLMLYFAFRRYLQAMNRVMPVMLALLTANLVNFAGNYALIYGHWGAPALGVEGSGWATTLSRVYLALALLAVILYHERQCGTGPVDWRIDFPHIRRLLALGLPAATQLTAEVLVFAVTAALISRLDAVSLAGHQIALNTVSLTYMVPLGISSAAAVRVGQALGRGNPREAAHAGWTALGLGAAFMSASALALTVIPQVIARAFTPDPAVIAAGASLLMVAAFFQLFDGLQTVATGALRGAGDTRTPMYAHLIAYWLVGLPLGSVACFVWGWGARGLWMGLSAALILLGLALLAAWRRMTLRWNR
jgi:MATE family multidrug resistance protein